MSEAEAKKDPGTWKDDGCGFTGTAREVDEHIIEAMMDNTGEVKALETIRCWGRSRVVSLIRKAKAEVERDEYRKMDARELGIYFRETGGDPRYLTADGEVILDGEVYWNNELKATRVNFKKTRFGRDWDGWFWCEDPYSKSPMATMNGERLAYKFEGRRPL